MKYTSSLFKILSIYSKHYDIMSIQYSRKIVKDLRIIGEGMVSKAFISDDKYILLVGKRDDSFSIYKNLKTDMDLLEGKIKSIKIPSNLKVIEPCKEYPFGALTYLAVPGREIDLKTCTTLQKKEIGKRLSEFCWEMHHNGLHWDKNFSIKHKNAKAVKNLKLLKPYFTKEENDHLQKLAKKYDKYLRESEYFVTHGDLHEENILVNNKNELTGVIDFGNMAYTPIEFEFAPIYFNLGKELWESFITNYPQKIDIEKVKIVLYFRAITFFEYVQGWSKEAILKEVQSIRDTGIFDDISTVDEIFDLYKKCLPFIIREESKVKEIIADKENHIISHRVGNKLVGVSVINGNTIYLLCVKKDSRSKGVGKKLLKESENYIKLKGFDKIKLGAGKDYIMPGVPMKENAHEFFKKYGYIHSWEKTGCFDMSMNLKDFVWNKAKIGDTIDGITYRFATKEDIPQISECVADAQKDFVQYYQEEKHYTKNTNVPVIIALDKNKVVGALIVSIETEGKDLGSVGCTATIHSHRGKGIATNMVCLGTKYLKEIGLGKAFLGYTYTDIVKMYARAGYQVCMEYFMAEKLQ